MGTLPLKRDRPLVSCSSPERGELQEQLKSLAAKKWHHPISGQRVQFGLSTIERWFYTARNAKRDPVQVLRRKIRSDHGQHPSLTPKLRELLVNQYRQHPNWSYQLHTDNLVVLIEKEPTPSLDLARRQLIPSYRFSRKLIRFDKAEVCATADDKLKINARRGRRPGDR